MVQKYTLKNGIPVFVVESQAAPVVSVQAWVSRGSIHEKKEVAGISHFLEHALFKGTARRKVGEIALEIERRGGEINAFTSFEETVYYTTMASRYFDDGLDIIADAVQSPTFDAQEMAREREVILEEIKRAQDSAGRTVSSNLWATLFKNTPYGRPVLGFVDTVKKIDHKTLRQYHSEHYHAGTVSLFVVGDVDAKSVVAKAQRQLGKLKVKKSNIVTAHKIPTLGSIAIVSASRDVKECQLQMAFGSPGITDTRIPALDLTCGAIGQGESSPLYQRLVKDTHLALDVQFGLAATRDCGMAAAGMQVSPENLVAAVTEARKLLEEMARTGLRERDIERVKSSLESDVVAGKETVDGYARRLGYYYIQFGDPNYEAKYLESVLGTTTEQANIALRELLKSKPVLSLVHPTDFKVDKAALKKALTVEKTNAPKKKLNEKLPVLTHKGTVRYVSKELHSLPVISLRFIFPGGSREEGPNELGLASLFQRVWTSGTKSYTALQISHTLESLGASLYAFSGKNTCGISVEFLSKQWESIKPILSEILLAPAFPEDEFATEKHIMQREILAERDTPGQLCHLNFVQSLYGDHPYGRSSIGTTKTVERLETKNLREYFYNYIHQKQLVVSVVGAFDRELFLEDLHQICSKLPPSGKDPRAKILPKPIHEIKITTEVKNPLHQSHLLVGFHGASFSDPDRYALKILSSCLSGQGGRLFLELRDKQSLAYTVSPMNNDAPEPGMFGFYIGCGPEKLETAITGIRVELDKILAKPMDATELKRAKEYWIGRFELELQRYASQAMLYGLDESYNLGFKQSFDVPKIIKALTAKDIQDAARKYLDPLRAVFSIVHNKPLDTNTVRHAWGVERSVIPFPEKRASLGA